jgi:fatty acid desaturase
VAGIPRDVSAFVAAGGMTRTSAPRSVGRTVAAVALYLSIGAAAGALDRPAGWAVAWGLQALLVVGSLSAMHEAAHGHLYRSPLPNRVSGILFAGAGLLNFSLYRAYHLRHHVEARTANDTEPRVEFASLARYLVTAPVLGAGFVLGMAYDTATTVLGRPPAYVRSPAQRRAVTVDAAVGLGLLAVLVALRPLALVTWWLAPLAVALVVVFPIVTLPEHYACDDDRDPLAHTRTVVSNPVFRFLYWNNNFHAEHHLCPSVPYHRAPELHAYLLGRQRHLERSYLGFQRSVVGDLRARHPGPATPAGRPHPSAR